ncbi:hypothetical protein [Clostridium sp. E02]|nr:hypothetical protein [Clostridium sp. E02]
MKKTLALILAAFMLSFSLTACRSKARKQIQPLFYHVIEQSMICDFS